MLKELLRSRGGALFVFTGSSGGGQVSPLRATYFLLVQKVGKDTFRGENTDSTSGAEKRALAHSIFSLKTPDFYGGAIKKCVRLLPARGNRIPCYLYLSLPLQWRLL